MGTLSIGRKQNQAVLIGKSLVIVKKITKDIVRLDITAPKEISIQRVDETEHKDSYEFPEDKKPN